MDSKFYIYGFKINMLNIYFPHMGLMYNIYIIYLLRLKGRLSGQET